MAPIGNRPPFNNNFAQPFPHPGHQFGQQMTFYPLPPSHNTAAFPTNVHESTNMAKISKLNREISNLKWSLECKSDFNSKLTKEKKDLEARCTKLCDELRVKDTELKGVKKGQTQYQNFPEQYSLKKQLAKIKDERNNLLREVNQYKVKVSQTQNVTDPLRKNLEEIQGENRRLELNLFLSERNSDEFQLELKQLQMVSSQLESENTAKASEIAKLKETVAEIKRDYDRRVEDSSSQISKLNDKNKKLEEDNEKLSANLGAGVPDLLIINTQLKSDLDACQAQLLGCTADLQKAREEKIYIVEEKNRLKADLSIANASVEISVERNAKLDLKLKVREDKCKEYIAEIEQLKQDFAADTERLKSDLDTCRGQFESYKAKSAADLRKEREEKNATVAERDRLKADLTKTNETIKVSEGTSAKLRLKLNRREDKCKEYIAEIDKLKQAQSQSLKAELKSAKKAYKELRAEHESLQTEANRLHNAVHRKWKEIHMKKLPSNDGQGSSSDEDENRKNGPVLRKRKKSNNYK